MVIKGKHVETIVDDDEGLSSFYATSLDPAEGYFCVAIVSGDNLIYCELNDQSNGFYSKTVKYTMTGRRITFRVFDDEYFDSSNRLNEVEVAIPDKEFDLEEIASCLKFIFRNEDAVSGQTFRQDAGPNYSRE
jgi:hypothetical protein